MSRSSAQLQTDRRTEILDAAKRCFARSGFHLASMQDICAEAGMSPGNLYRYFKSKEALIAGIAERDRAEVGQTFERVDASADFFAVLEGLARHHFVERPQEDVQVCTEIMTESRRNPDIARIFQSFDADVKARLLTMLQQAAERGDVDRDIDFESVVLMLMVIADGVWWRRASDPSFDPETMIPVLMDITRYLLGRSAARANKGTSQ